MNYGNTDDRLVEIGNLEIILVLIAAAGLCLAYTTNQAVVNNPPIAPIPPIPFPLAQSVPLRDVSSTLRSVTGDKISGISIISSGSQCFIQIFDASPSSVTLGTTIPIMEFTVLGGGQSDFPLSTPIQITTGILVASTTTEKGAVGSAPGIQVFVRT